MPGQIVASICRPPWVSCQTGWLFAQLGLQFHELRWLGPRYPGPCDESSTDPGRFTDLLRASYALVMRKPHDTVIPLRVRETKAAVAMAPTLVPTRRVATLRTRA